MKEDALFDSSYFLPSLSIFQSDPPYVTPWSQLAHSCRSLSRFLLHEVARSISTSPGRDASPSQVTSPQFVRFPQQFAGTHVYAWVERGTMELSVLPKNTTQFPRPGLDPGPLAPESSAVTMRPPRLPRIRNRWI